MSPLSPPIQSVVQLFRGPLAGVRFADIDATGLTSLASEIESAAAEVQAQEAKLVELKQSLAQRHDSLLALAQQALAYARIFAEGDEALSAELAQIALPRAAKPRKKDATPKPAEAPEAIEPESSTIEPAPISTETVTARVTETEMGAEATAEEPPVAVAANRRARGRAKTGTAYT